MSDETANDSSPVDTQPQDALVHQSQGAIAAPETLKTNLDQLAQEVLQLKLAALSETNTAEAAVKRLQGRIWWLRAVLVVTFFAFGGVVTWQALTLRQQQLQILQMDSVVSDLEATQPEQLQQQLADLQEQVSDDLPETLAQTQEELTSLQTDVEALGDTIGERQRALVVLTEALQALVNDGVDSVDEDSVDEDSPETAAEEAPAEEPTAEEPAAPAEPSPDTPDAQ